MPASFSYAQPSEANSIVGGDVEQLKQRWPLLDYLQQQNWAARPAGYDSEFVGLCPLHQETRPSFYVNARKNLFYCHGCGQGGDLIRFVELSRHLSFRQSLAYLEQQSAPPVDSVDSATVLKEVTAFYREQLDRYPEALRYLERRGVVVSRGKKWYGYFRKTVFDPTTNQQKGDVISVVLGLKSQMKASEAREGLEREITKQTGQSGPNAGRAMNDSSVTFGWFVRNRFFPLKEAHWKEETAKVKKLLIQRDLIDPFDKTPFGNLDKFTLQVHLNNLAKTSSKDRVQGLPPRHLRGGGGSGLSRQGPSSKGHGPDSAARHGSDDLDLVAVARCALKARSERPRSLGT